MRTKKIEIHSNNEKYKTNKMIQVLKKGRKYFFVSNV